MQSVTGKVERLRRVRLIEAAKNVLNRVPQIRPYTASIVAFVEPCETLVLKAPYHNDTT